MKEQIQALKDLCESQQEKVVELTKERDELKSSVSQSNGGDKDDDEILDLEKPQTAENQQSNVEKQRADDLEIQVTQLQQQVDKLKYDCETEQDKAKFEQQ